MLTEKFAQKIKDVFGLENDQQLWDYELSADMAVSLLEQTEKEDRAIPQFLMLNKSGFELPRKQTAYSSGVDLRASMSFDDLDEFTIEPWQRQLIPTGIYVDLPKGYEAQIRPRSGLAVKHGLTVLNTPGTIDSDYRGEIKVLVINLSNEPYTVHNGDRIAQMVVQKVELFTWQETTELGFTQRGDGGFGSTD